MNPYSDLPWFVQEVYAEGDKMCLAHIHLISVCDYDNPNPVYYWEVVA